MNKLQDILGRFFKFDQQNIKKDWKLIALCILGATIFWFFQALNKENYTTTLSYPVDFQFDQTDSLIVVEELPSEVEINVTGGGWSLFRKSLGLSNKPLIYKLEQPTQTPYLLGATLLGPIVEQVSTLQVNAIVTDTLRLHIERKITRKIPLQVDSQNIDLSPGYRIVGALSLDSDTLEVTGPQSFLNLMEQVFEVVLPESDISKNYDEVVDLELPKMEGLVYQPKEVRVRFLVNSFVQQSKLVPIVTKNFPDDSSLALDQSEVNCSFMLPAEYMDSLSFFSLEAVVDLTKMHPTDSTVVPQLLRIPSYLEEVKLDSMPIRVIHAQ